MSRGKWDFIKFSDVAMHLRIKDEKDIAWLVKNGHMKSRDRNHTSIAILNNFLKTGGRYGKQERYGNDIVIDFKNIKEA